MGTIDDYLGSLDASDRDIIAGAYAVAREVAPDAVQGKSYGMPALIASGKALIAIMRTRQHYGVYPFSGRVPAVVGAVFDDLDADKGTIRFPPGSPIDEDVVRAIVVARMAEIEDPSLRKRPVD